MFGISKIDKAQALKILKAFIYVSVSAGISYLITLTTDQPELFGVFTIVINSALVAVKQLFTQPEA